MNDRPANTGYVSILLIALTVCAAAAPASASRIIYLAEQEYAYVNELYVVDLSVPGVSTKLNRPLSPFAEGIATFAISPDGATIVFSGDQTTAGDPDLYLVNIASPGTWTRIGNLAAGHREMFAKFSPDGKKLAFTASDAFFADVQLYAVDLASPGQATRVNGRLAPGGAVSLTGFEFTTDGRYLVYTAGELEQKFELYAVDLTTPGHSVRLNATGGNVGDSWEGRFRVLPDGSGVVYTAVWEHPGIREVQLVSLDQPGLPVTLNAAFQPKGYVSDYSVSPDGRFVGYTADQETDGLPEVYVVRTDSPGTATKLNGPTRYGASLVRFTPDSRKLLYASDEERGGGVRDLFAVSPDAPGDRVRLNPPLDPGHDIEAYVLNPDGTQVAYRISPPGGSATDLLVTRLDTPGTAIKVNGPLPNGALEFVPPRFSPDGSELAFQAVESVADSIQELFFARLTEPGISIRLNEPLPKDAIVSPSQYSFEFLPANAPPTGSAPANSPGGQADSNSGGGSMGWFSLLLLLACKRKLQMPWLARTGSVGRGEMVFRLLY